MTKILLLAPKYPPETGGASVYFDQLVELLEETEYDVTVFAPKHPDVPSETDEHGATVCRIFPQVGARIYIGLAYLDQFQELLSHVGPDIAHVHPHFPQYRWFRWLLKVHQIPRVYDCRDKDFSRRYVKDGSFYLSATEDIDSILTSEIGVDNQSITRCPVCLQNDEVQSQRLGPGDHVGFCGDLTKHKGLEYTVNAVASFLPGGEITLHVAGDGPLREWVEDLDRDVNWLEYHGELDHSDSMRLIHSVDVVCLPSLREGRPRVALEAMELGTPVVGSNAGDIPDVVGEAGIIVNRSVPAVTDGIETVLGDSRYQEAAMDRGVSGESKDVLQALCTAYESVERGLEPKPEGEE